MQNWTLTWGILVMIGVAVMAVLGFFCPYVSKRELELAEKIKDAHISHTLKLRVKNRYSYKIIMWIELVFVILAIICVVLEKDADIADSILRNPLIFTVAYYAIISAAHVLILPAMFSIAFYAMGCVRLEYICEKCLDKYNIGVVNCTFFRILP